MLEVVIETLSISAGGAIVAVITILLLQRTGDLSLPITIKVQDYLGGIVIGLFSGKLGEILYQRLHARPARSDDGEAGEHAEGEPDREKPEAENPEDAQLDKLGGAFRRP